MIKVYPFTHYCLLFAAIIATYSDLHLLDKLEQSIGTMASIIGGAAAR